MDGRREEGSDPWTDGGKRGLIHGPQWDRKGRSQRSGVNHSLTAEEGEKQQNLHPHHKPYSHYHHQAASDDYQGSFQSCFHFGDSYRMEQSVSGVHVPADSHGYTSHQHNGFHMSSTSSGSAAGFSLAQDLQGSGECQFSSSPEESIFFQVNSFDRSLSQMSSVYTET
ncbi:unnamed protein product [Coregonus sp. 'balchen']|nr:unnamed protein product [Coregonus sp. 'balchen']